MDEMLKNLYILSKTYDELYRCCEKLSSLYLDLQEKERVSSKVDFKELLKKYNKSEKNYFVEENTIKKNIREKLEKLVLLQKNLIIKEDFIKQLEKKINT